MHRKAIWRLLAAALALFSFTNWSQFSSPLKVHSQADYPACGNLPPAGDDPKPVLILMQGLGTSASSYRDQQERWAFLISELTPLYDQVLYFSYNRDDPTRYDATDTYHSLWNHHLLLLHDLLESCHELGWQSFDIIGHSLGGVIASEYIKLYGLNSSQAGWVRHVITLDSPVNGSSRLALGDFAFLPWPKTAFQSPAARDMAGMYLSRDTLVQLNAQITQRLRDMGIEYWNLTSAEDLAVPTDDAIVNDEYGRIYHLGVTLSGDMGHNQVFSSPEARDDIRSILTERGAPPHVCTQAVSSGDSTGLVVAINQANSRTGSNTICLAAGTYALAEAGTNPYEYDPLIISGDIAIIGAGPIGTLIQGVPFEVSETGRLHLQHLSLEGGFFDNTNYGTLLIDNVVLAGFLHALLNDGTAIIRDCVFSNNSGVIGAAISNGGTLIIENTQFIGNSGGWNIAGDYFGGSIHNSGTLTIAHSTFTDNYANMGGAIAVTGGQVSISQSVFSNNYADGGGAIWISGGSVDIVDSRFQENRAVRRSAQGFELGGYGGAIWNVGGHVTVQGSRFENNSGDVSSGIHNDSGTVQITASCILNNNNLSVFNSTLSITDARNNWWGASDGPSGAGSGSGDSVGDNVDFLPFLAERPECSASVTSPP